jgi:hypothetical protein
VSERDADALAVERRHRWLERYKGGTFAAPVPTWWPWAYDEVSFRDGDPQTGLIAMDIEPAPGARSAVLVRQPIGEEPYSYGWPELAWHPDYDPETTVHAHQWAEGDWQWTIFVIGRPLTEAEITRIRSSIEWHELPCA